MQQEAIMNKATMARYELIESTQGRLVKMTVRAQLPALLHRHAVKWRAIALGARDVVEKGFRTTRMVSSEDAEMSETRHRLVIDRQFHFECLASHFHRPHNQCQPWYGLPEAGWTARFVIYRSE